MDRGRAGRRLTEWVKNLLIFLLSCSAIWLAMRVQLIRPTAPAQGAPEVVGQPQAGERVQAVRPLQIAATLPGGAELSRYGAQYQQGGADAVFQQVAALLAESLSSVGQPEMVTQRQWEQALSRAPGVYFDFQGEIPMPVLVGWMSGEATSLNATVRRLVLTLWKDSVAVYYQDQRDGAYYRCLSGAANPQQLEHVLSGLSDNGARFAFESEEFSMLAPDTLLTQLPAGRAVYTAANPMSGQERGLETLMEDLGFPAGASSFYPAAGEQVARSGNDTVRLSSQGVAVYRGGEGAGEQFRITAQSERGTLVQAVERCRSLAVNTLGRRSGEARVYLMSVLETTEGWQVDFGLSLNGVPVQQPQGYAARFVVADGRITEFTLALRQYTQSSQSSLIIPPVQAAAALVAMGLEGEEMTLLYRDTGGESVSADWVAGQGEKG